MHVDLAGRSSQPLADPRYHEPGLVLAPVAHRTVIVPNAADVRHSRGFLTNTDWTIRPGDTATVRFHERWCHMQPWMLSALAAWGLRARAMGMHISTENADTAGYAWRFGLQNYLGVDAPELQEHEEAGRFVPLKTVISGADLGGLIADLVPLLHLADQPEHGKAVQYAVSEMVRNALEHANSDWGAVVSAQHYAGRRGARYVSLGVADPGVGVLRSLGRNYPGLASDRDAVLTAVQPGTTGAPRGSENAGAGLFFTRSLSDQTGRYFVLYSGSALLRTTQARERPGDERLVFDVHPYPGTVVAVEVGLGDAIDLTNFVEATRALFYERSERTARRAAELVTFT